MKLEIPVAAPIAFAGETLLEHQATRLPSGRASGAPVRGGQLDQLEWVGRYLGRIHSVSASHAFHHRVPLDVESMLHEPRQLLAAGEWLPSGLAKSFFGVLDELIRHVCNAMTLDVARISPCMGTATRATSCGVTAPVCRPRRLPHWPRHPGSLDDAERGAS